MRKKPKFLKVDPVYPEPDGIEKAAKIIRNRGMICFPTTSLYGLGADALNADAVDQIFEIKARPHDKPILVLIHDIRQLNLLVKRVSPIAEKIMEKFWPGGVTLIFKAKDHLPHALTAGSGKIGIRLAYHPVASALAKAVGSPITGTSANLSGQPGISKIDELDPMLAERLDLILDAGELIGGQGSTIVDTTSDIPMILREVRITSSEISAIFR